MAQAKRKLDKPPLARHIQHGLRECALYLLIALALYLMLTLLTYDVNDPGWSYVGPREHAENLGGVVGAWFADVSFYLFGYLAFLIPVAVAYSGWLVMRYRTSDNKFDAYLLLIRWIGFALLAISGCGLLGIHFSVAVDALPTTYAGGVLGHTVGNEGLAQMFNVVGVTVILVALFLVSVTLATGLSWLSLLDKTGQYVLIGVTYLYRRLLRLLTIMREIRRAKRVKQERQEVFNTAQKQEGERQARAKKLKIEPKVKTVIKPNSRKFKEQQISLFEGSKEGALPPLHLLAEAKEQTFGFSDEALEAMSRLLELKLDDFGVQAEVVAVQPGPVVTRFELSLAAGTKASKITGLAKDLARSMSVVSVRVVEVIPGKSVIGIEIPNEKREIISFQEIVCSEVYEKSRSPLTIGLGKNINGLVTVVDLAKMPHLLVAGTTGSGKSVAINAMLLSLLYKSSAYDVRLILIDPKMLELNVYDGIPHLLCPVVTDMKDATNALRWGVGEMERRYKLMSTLGVRNITGYNRKVADAKERGEPIVDPMYKKEEALDPEAPAPVLEHMPFIVVIIDEFADMMMVVGKKAEELIARLAQKARAAGIHLLLATQRPSVDVITGLIKANVPTRIAFQVSSKIDSRTILDQMGAEQLLGHGDMLYMQPGASNVPERIHGAFVDDHEVHRVVEYLKQTGEPNYIDAILEESTEPIAGLTGIGGALQEEDLDPLYDQAVRIVTESRKASISYVQRQLKVGYNRSARMLEQMEEQGVVSTLQGNGSREVIAPPPPQVD